VWNVTRRNDHAPDERMWRGLPPEAATIQDEREEKEKRAKGSRSDQNAHEDSWYQVLRRLRDRSEDEEPSVPA
jgi:hypothetical protein